MNCELCNALLYYVFSYEQLLAVWQSSEAKSRDVDLIAAEISTVDAIAAGVKVPPVNGIEDVSDTTSVSDDTPPSTPSSRGSSDHRRSRRRTVQDSHVSSSSSPARGWFTWRVFYIYLHCETKNKTLNSLPVSPSAKEFWKPVNSLEVSLLNRLASIQLNTSIKCHWKNTIIQTVGKTQKNMKKFRV